MPTERFDWTNNYIEGGLAKRTRSNPGLGEPNCKSDVITKRSKTEARRVQGTALKSSEIF